MLIVFAGLPGTGKTTLARAVAARLRAAYLQVDAISTALVTAGLCPEVGAAGYLAAERVAAGCVSSGLDVVVDGAHAVPESREPWLRSPQAVLFVEVRCSDGEEHRRRVESRAADPDGLRVPGWAEVQAARYEPWDHPRLVVDNVGAPERYVEEILDVADRREAGLIRAARHGADVLSSGSALQLERLLHPAFVWTSEDGRRLNREAYIELNTGWSWTWRSQVLDDVQAVVSGDVGVVTAVVSDTADTAGRTVRRRMPVTQTWQRDDGAWVCLAAHVGPTLDGP